MTRAARREREPGVIPVTACLGRDRKAADAADRRRALARDRKRRERDRKKDDGNVVRVLVTVDYDLACELVDKGFLEEWNMEDRAAVTAAAQKWFDVRKQYE
jgi:hypothetical protein